MLNTDDEDALGEELIEMAGVKEIYKKPKKDDSDDYGNLIKGDYIS